MVASAKSRSIVGSPTNQYSLPNPQNQRNADGRRQLRGLSQAIREKAHQSTSPRSEVHSTSYNQSRHEISALEKSKGIPSIEDRLRSLFNSDTEEVNNIKKLKNRSKTTGPRTTATDFSSSRILKDKMTLSFNEGTGEQIAARLARRCVSALPAGYNDKDWNKISMPNQQFPAAQRNTANSAFDLQQKYTTVATSHTKPRPSSSVPYYTAKTSGDVNGYRPIPLTRRSLYAEKDKTLQNANIYVNLSHQVPVTSTFATPATATKSFVRPATALGTERGSPASNHLQNGDEPQQVTSTQQHIYLPRKPSEAGSVQVHLRHVDFRAGPSPCYRLDKPRDASADKIGPATNDNSPAPLSAAPRPKPLPNTRTYYPQQNFSFRRAVRRSMSSESELANNDTRRNQTLISDLPQGVEKSSRKSDDRDSGTVVEPEVSVFDFESPVASDDDTRPTVQSTPSHPVTPISSRLKDLEEDRSGSSTPILPPLSSDGEYTDVAETEEQERSSPGQTYILKNPIQSNGGERKNAPHSGCQYSTSMTTNGIAELSTTESAMQDKSSKSKDHKPKFVAVKTNRLTPSPRRASYGRISSGDEKRTKRSYHRRYYDDSDATDCSTRMGVYRSPSGKVYRHESPYRTAYCVAKEKSDFGDTSSVRSMTTASVCSSVLRKGGSRRHHHHHRKYHSGSDKCSREIRSMTKRFSRLEAHVVTLARGLAQVSSEVRQMNAMSTEVEQLRQQIKELRTRQALFGEVAKSNKTGSKSSKSGSHSKSRFGKFFGEQTPMLHVFLKQLGYEKFIKNFENQSIGMMELPYLDEKRLQDIGIPLGPSIRIMKEAQKSSFV